MPLKNSDDSQKVSKAINKEIDKVKKAIPQPKENTELEYNCNIYFKYNPQKKKQQYAIQLETIKLFSTLNYNITLNFRKEKKEIDIVLLGLKPDQAYSNMAEAASTELLFDEIYGEHIINIIKKDGSINSVVVDFNVFKKEIKIKKDYLPEKKNNRKFCTFNIAEEKFTFSQE